MIVKRNNDAKALYIHVPFCSHICSYCDFPKMFYYPDFADKYLKTLEKELADESKYTSIYIGGGTPTSLDQHQFAKLLELANKHLDDNASFCIEVNPENCDEVKVKLMANYGINRVSIGVQTFDDVALKYLNRAHTREQVEKLIQIIIKQGINNISCDLIYGLTNQSIDDLEKDLKILVNLPIKHISTYPLTIEKNTLFQVRSVTSVNDETLLKMYRHINKFLKAHDFKRYEISNFALPGFESNHNLVYWHNQGYRGVGPGASGYEHDIRYSISRKFNDYFAGIVTKEEQIITDRDFIIEYVMLHLRTTKGIVFSEYLATFNVDFKCEFKEPLVKLVSSGLIKLNKQRVFLTEKGIFLENYIILELIKHL